MHYSMEVEPVPVPGVVLKAVLEVVVKVVLEVVTKAELESVQLWIEAFIVIRTSAS